MAAAVRRALGVDDDHYGQRLVTFVVLADGSTITTDDLKAYARQNLANYKVPRAITVLDVLPRDSTGKIVRRELQALVEPA
jgi:acyl-CoA synthetase (AMP-forming)/AMP-acid ligase II